ncbi:hypothetical protein [Planctomycetes bacterium K23_9]|uniref:Uncharacterized protein n=1 Tax=Stieleria marina TaxID=1930275 RepID=A0A517NN41_9BACT|nr:hypothetical protein K239x_04520 [Planctomycetes bacterium K23_9]
MNAMTPEYSDDDFAGSLRNAFDDQPIPPKPLDRDVLAKVTASTCEPETPRPFAWNGHSRFSQMAALIPVVAASLVLVVAFWRTETPTASNEAVERPKNAVAQQPIQSEIPKQNPVSQLPDGPNLLQDKVIDAEISTVHDKSVAKPDPQTPQQNQESKPTPENQEKIETNRIQFQFLSAKTAFASLTNYALSIDQLKNGPFKDVRFELDERTNSIVFHSPYSKTIEIGMQLGRLDVEAALDIIDDTTVPSTLMSAVRLTNACVALKRWDAIKLTDAFQPYLSNERNATLRAFQSLGLPKGVKSLRLGPGKRRQWLSSPETVAYTYIVDFPDLLTDMKRFVDALLGEEIFDDMLDGIRDDPAGPQIDIREVAKSMDFELVLVAKQSREGNRKDSTMFAMSLKQSAPVAQALERVMAVEPDSAKQSIGGTNIYIIQRGDEPAKATCIAGDCLVIGDANLVRESILRFDKR